MKRIIRLTESDLTRIVRRVINESYLIKEDQSKIQPVQQQVNLAVEEMNKAINDYAKQQQPPTQLPNIKIKPGSESVPVKAADGSQTNVNIDSYFFDLNGKQPKTGIYFSRIVNNEYKIFQAEWNGSLGDQTWLMNVGAGNVGRNLSGTLKTISDKYLAAANKLLGSVTQKPGAKQ
jgi:hypothetical protein